VNPLPPIRRALVSVSDKRELELLAQILIDCQVEVLSTGGTFAVLEALGVAAVKVSEYTGAPEILGGRVKTLHPKIHGGILALPSPAHEAELRLHGIAAIDLVVVNLYPFREVTARPDCDFAEAVENIDIGGPTMVRAAAKNWQRVAVVVDPADYAALGEALAANGRTLPARPSRTPPRTTRRSPATSRASTTPARRPTRCPTRSRSPAPRPASCATARTRTSRPASTRCPPRRARPPVSTVPSSTRARRSATTTSSTPTPRSALSATSRGSARPPR
jgi:hypothetical protein